MIPSATGTASQIPVNPHILGKSNIPPASKPNVRKNDRIAETFPFDNAVNIDDVNMFRPQNRKLYEKIVNPSAAI